MIGLHSRAPASLKDMMLADAVYFQSVLIPIAQSAILWRCATSMQWFECVQVVYEGSRGRSG